MEKMFKKRSLQKKKKKKKFELVSTKETARRLLQGKNIKNKRKLSQDQIIMIRN